MPGIVHDLRVFIATPSGLEVERQAFRDIAQEYNELDPQGRRVIFTPIGWELTLGGYGRPQALINKDLIECDYFVLVLWDRWGTPPDAQGKFTSGCEEEFNLALQCLEDPKYPMREVIVFFKEVDKKQLSDPGDQLKKVLAFKVELERSKKHLFMTVSDITSFQTYMRRFLVRWSRDHSMPPTEHLDLIKQGVALWNAWRQANPWITPRLAGADLRGMYLSGIDLSSADLTRADLSGSDLIGANLHKANLSEANLTRSNLYGTNLTEANLSEAIIVRTHLSNANIARAVFFETIFANTDLSSVIGLTEVIHHGPSDIGVHSLYQSQGNVPETFLLQCGIPELFVSFARSLTGKAVDFYSCFISYSHADQGFARRLHDALQARGVRCWLDEHQLIPGQDIYAEIDRGIRLWDKVLLCCSESALSSWWVNSEIDAARNKEEALVKKSGVKRLSLIPLNLDGFLFSEKYKSDKADMLRMRLAADFTNWESDNAKFERQLERLLKALRFDDGDVPPTPKL